MQRAVKLKQHETTGESYETDTLPLIVPPFIEVEKHAPKHKRGQYTSWIQISVVGGFLLCLIMVLAVRGSMTTVRGWSVAVPELRLNGKRRIGAPFLSRSMRASAISNSPRSAC